MTAPTRDEVIQMALDAGIYTARGNCVTPTFEIVERLVAAAYARGVAFESNRADALAATIAELRDLATTEGETKADFVARVRAVLGEDPDARVVRAVLAEREACANVAKNISDKYAYGYYGQEVDTADEIAAAIRARTTPTTAPPPAPASRDSTS